MVPAEGGPKFLELKSSWHRMRRSKFLAVSLTHWKGRRGGGRGIQGGVPSRLLRCTAILIHHCPTAHQGVDRPPLPAASVESPRQPSDRVYAPEPVPANRFPMRRYPPVWPLLKPLCFAPLPPKHVPWGQGMGRAGGRVGGVQGPWVGGSEGRLRECSGRSGRQGLGTTVGLFDPSETLLGRVVVGGSVDPLWGGAWRRGASHPTPLRRGGGVGWHGMAYLSTVHFKLGGRVHRRQVGLCFAGGNNQRVERVLNSNHPDTTQNTQQPSGWAKNALTFHFQFWQSNDWAPSHPTP